MLKFGRPHKFDNCCNIGILFDSEYKLPSMMWVLFEGGYIRRWYI